MSHLYVIERRVDGQLQLDGRQPESVFGHRSISGISEDAMAKAVFRHKPDAPLRGDNIPSWPSFIDPAWVARVKTW